MPPSHNKNNSTTRFDFRKDIFATLFLALGIFFGICLISYSPTDPALNSVSNVPYVKNWCGIVGAYIADILFIIFGISAYLASFVFILMSILQYLGKPIRFRLREVTYYGGLLTFAAAIIHLKFQTITIRGHEIAGGGIIGGLLGSTLTRYLNTGGAFVIASAGFLLFFTLATKLSISEIARGIKISCAWAGRSLWSGIKWTTCKANTVYQTSITILKDGIVALFNKSKKQEVQKKEPEKLIDPTTPNKHIMHKIKMDEVISIEPIRQSRLAKTSTPEDSTMKPNPALDARTSSVPNTATLSKASNDGPRILKRADTKPRRPIDDQLQFQRMSAEGYEPPPLALLDAPERQKVEVDEDTLKKNSLLVEKKLKDFDVDGKVIAIHPGPVITMYEFEPATGTKVGKVVGLQDDLSLTLGGRSVRVIPHLPGKAALGIEIPNSDREMVWLKETLSAPQFHKIQSRLPLALGSSTSGHPVVADLTKMPHLLVAGATGSGKSVAINSFIASIVCKSSPADVRFILVDPKMLELSVYDGIPHLLLPVVTKPKPAVAAMRWAIREMERRYRLMADTGTRNLLSYNEKIKAGQVELTSPEEALQKTSDPEAIVHTGIIPYIVIIIDELADLMMTASQDMEELITRLAQMARAAGIHLILATQRPSVDVITGLIKANFPARIAFKVTSRHDSRTILDGNGAEALLGNGDMLFMTPQGGNLIRIHGSYLTDSDIQRIVDHLKSQGEPIYDESITAEPEKDVSGEEFEEGDDELYDQAVRLVADTKQASISMVQRRLRIGYNRAARMIERMESEGVVGPADGSRPRQVLANNT